MPDRQPRYQVTFAMGGSLSAQEFEDLLRRALQEEDRQALSELQGEVDEIESVEEL